MTIAHDVHTSVVAATYIHILTSDTLNKNSLAIIKCEANQKQGYKHLISRKAKKTKLLYA